MAEIARLESIAPDTVSSVLREFHEIATARSYYLQGGLSFAEEVLVATLGPALRAARTSPMDVLTEE